MIARIVPIVRLPRNLHEFDYAVPDDMRETCLPGTFVTIPFRKKKVAGLVWSIEKKNERAYQPIARALPLRYEAWDAQRQHIEWFARHYFISRATALKTLLPEFPRSYLSTGVLRTRRAPSSPLHEAFFKERYHIHCTVIKNTLKKKKSALFFFPTIHDGELFEPTARTAAGSHEVLVLHSALSPSALFSRWAALFDGSPRCIIATRTGAGVPLYNVGTLVIDSSERIEHNQYDLNPRFDVRTTAFDMQSRMRCSLTHISDTPRLEEYALLTQPLSGNSSSITMPVRSASPSEEHPDSITIVNMRDEIRSSGRGYISERLIDVMQECLTRERGVFLFLNRTGASRMITCRDCSHVFSCMQCGSPTRAAQSHLNCDRCGTNEILPPRCPACHSIRFHFIALGTEKIVELVKKEFPRSNVLEFTQEKHPRELIKHLHTTSGTPELRNTIIVGTSYLPRACPESFRSIGCVGVLSADPVVTLSDFRSEERQVQLLFHLASLARNGNAQLILQTFSPERKAIQALSADDYRQYAENALVERAAHGWPPAVRLIRLRIPNHLSSRSLDSARKMGSGSVSRRESVPDPIFNSECIVQECTKLGATLRSKTNADLLFSLPQPVLPDAQFSNDLQDYLLSLPADLLIDIDPVVL